MITNISAQLCDWLTIIILFKSQTEENKEITVIHRSSVKFQMYSFLKMTKPWTLYDQLQPLHQHLDLKKKIMSIFWSPISGWPRSPHVRVLTIGGISVYPKSFSTVMWELVRGCSHMWVFIAGQKMRGRDRSHALTTQVCRWTDMWKAYILLYTRGA